MRLVLPAVFLGFLCLPAATLSQAASTAPSPIFGQAAFANEPAVLRNMGLVMQYNADGTGTRTETHAFTLQSEAALRSFGVLSLPYASASQTADFVYVRVRRPDGTVVDTPPTDIQEQTPPVTQQAPFYSDIKIKQIPVRGARLGDSVEWQTRVIIKQPEAPNQFWGATPFVRDVVTLHQTVELRVPANSPAKVWTNPVNHVTPEKTTEGNETVYRWEWKSLEPTLGRDLEAAKRASEGKFLNPEEEADQVQGRLPDVAFTTFPDWAAVGAWYRGMEGDRMQPDAVIRAKVAEITAHSATEQDKVRAVYDWVSSNIRYVGVALGVGRYQPHAAANVLENQYGDCKDKHTLLASMLLALGEQPDAVLIGPGIRFNSAVPSPGAFNHLITRLTLDGKPVWLDSTSEVAAFQVLVPAVRDKDGLVVPTKGPASIQRTPSGYPFPPFATMAIEGKLNKDLSSDATVIYRIHDDSELAIRRVLRQMSPAQSSAFLQKSLASLGFTGAITEVAVQNLNDQEKPLTLSFHYNRTHQADWGPNRIPAIFGPSGVLPVDETKPPVSSIRLGMPRTEESVLDLQLPEGWSAELPEATHQQLPQVRIDTTYALQGRMLHAKRITTIVSDHLPAAEWKQYQKWYQASNAGVFPYIQLVSPGSAHPVGPAIAGAPASAGPGAVTSPAKPRTEAERLAEAARLVASASDKLRRNEVDGAEQELNEAKALNENQETLWGNLGIAASLRGKNAEALKDYRKEVELYPRSDFAWRNIVNLEMHDDPKSAEPTAREWVAASPAALDPRMALIDVLWALNQNTAALTAAKEAASTLPGDVRESNTFQLLLGQAQLRGGETGPGAETLSHLIQSDATTLQSNDADYELAKNHLQLALAETTQRDVLKKLGAESLAWTGDEAPGTMRNASILFSAAWDTMGWILFQEGKLAEALPYVHAAWLNRANTEIGEHLGDVQTAMHRDREAARSYVLANSLQSGSDPATASAALKRKADAASQKFHDVLGGKQPADLLAEERTFAVPGGGDLSGSAVYDLLFTREHVVRVKAAPGNTSPALDQKAREINLAPLFPPGESAALYHTTTLTCKAGACSVRINP